MKNNVFTQAIQILHNGGRHEHSFSVTGTVHNTFIFIAGGLLLGIVVDKVILKQIKKIAVGTKWEGDEVIILALHSMTIFWFVATGIFRVSGNVIMVGMAGKIGHPISFKIFMRYGMLLMIESIIICTVYVWIRYYIL